MITTQLNAILHHERFQKIEAAWRGLLQLVEAAGDAEDIRIRLLHATWRELDRDFQRASDFDQSSLFHKVYTEEFGTAGGLPFSVLIGDYTVRHRPSAEHPYDDVTILRELSHVAAAAFAPCLVAASPALLGLDQFTDIHRPSNLAETFRHPEYIKWRSLRDTEDSRFVGLVLPRVLMRKPYADDGAQPQAFRFVEEVRDPTGRTRLWGNAAFAFGTVLIRTFRESGWLADIRGFRRGEIAGGLVDSLPYEDFPTDAHNAIARNPVETYISDEQEKVLNDMGLIPLCRSKDTPYAVFYGNQSLQKPKRYDTASASANARISAMIQYMLCTGRIAHFLKLMARNKIGSMISATDLESHLTKWITGYVTADAHASTQYKARYPLREAAVQIREQPDAPGSYRCIMHLLPHFQLDDLQASVRLVTELTGVNQ